MKRCLKRWLYVALALAVVGCASQKVVESSNASKDLEDRYSGRVGAATKTDFVQEFGTAESGARAEAPFAVAGGL